MMKTVHWVEFNYSILKFEKVFLTKIQIKLFDIITISN